MELTKEFGEDSNLLMKNLFFSLAFLHSHPHTSPQLTLLHLDPFRPSLSLSLSLTLGVDILLKSLK